MEHSSRIRPTTVVENRTTVADRIVGFLRERHPLKTAQHVEASTGIPAATIARWLDRGSAPSACAVFALIGAYGPEFIKAAHPGAPDWLDQAARVQERERVSAQIERLQAKLRGELA